MIRKPSRNLPFRRRVIARAARASLIKGISTVVIARIAEDTNGNVQTLRLQGRVYVANWMYTDRSYVLTIEA